MYWTVYTLTTVGYGDIPNDSTAQQLCSIFVQLVGIVFFAYVVGTITAQVQKLGLVF